MAASDEFGRHLGQSLHPALCRAGLLARGAQPGTGRHHRRSTRLSWLDEGLRRSARSVVTKIRDVARPPHIPGNSQFPQREFMIPLLRAFAVGLDFTILKSWRRGSGDGPESHTLP